jgi:hypothetical protein
LNPVDAALAKPLCKMKEFPSPLTNHRPKATNLYKTTELKHVTALAKPLSNLCSTTGKGDAALLDADSYNYRTKARHNTS